MYKNILFWEGIFLYSGINLTLFIKCRHVFQSFISVYQNAKVQLYDFKSQITEK